MVISPNELSRLALVKCTICVDVLNGGAKAVVKVNAVFIWFIDDAGTFAVMHSVMGTRMTMKKSGLILSILKELLQVLSME